jgi:hypothetical protein
VPFRCLGIKEALNEHEKEINRRYQELETRVEEKLKACSIEDKEIIKAYYQGQLDEQAKRFQEETRKFREFFDEYSSKIQELERKEKAEELSWEDLLRLQLLRIALQQHEARALKESQEEEDRRQIKLME